MRYFWKCRFKKFYFVLVTITLISCFIIFYLSKFTLDKIIEIQDNNKYVRRGRFRIPQIVGHYMPGISVNVSSDFLNSNNYSPIPGEGEKGSKLFYCCKLKNFFSNSMFTFLGNPVVIPSKDLLKMQQLFQINRFNLLASDRVSVNRTLQDVRNHV